MCNMGVLITVSDTNKWTWIWQWFLRYENPKSQATKTRTKRTELHKMKHFCISKDTIKKSWKFTVWEKIFVNHIPI